MYKNNSKFYEIFIIDTSSIMFSLHKIHKLIMIYQDINSNLIENKSNN